LAWIGESNKVVQIPIAKKVYDFGLGRVFKVERFESNLLVCYEQRGLLIDTTFTKGKLLSFGLRNFCFTGKGILYSSSRDIHFTSKFGFQKTIIGFFDEDKIQLKTMKLDLSSSSKAPYLRPYVFCKVTNGVFIGSNKGLYFFDSSKIQAVGFREISRFSQVSEVKRLWENHLAVVVNDFFVFLINYQTKEVVNEAQYKGLIIQENYAFQFHPQWYWILENLKEIGDIICIKSAFDFPPRETNTDFRYNKFLGGGALLSGCVQEEIMFTNHPELFTSQLLCEVMK
jgi:hypothetical protein